MGIPYTYKSTIEIQGAENYTTNEIIEVFFKELVNNNLLSEYRKKGEKINFHYLSLFNIKYPVEITIKNDNLLIITYETKLIKLIQISLVLIVITAFFSSFGVSGFLWFSAILTLIFFSANVLFIESGIRKLIKSTDFYQNLNPGKEGQFSKEQMKWMKDVNKCPACGEKLNLYDINCPECGLKLPRKPIAKPFDVSKYDNKRLSYHYKPQKPKNDP